MNMLTIKNFKTGHSREFGAHGAYNFTVYFNNKRGFVFVEEGNGGEPYVDTIDREVETKIRQYIQDIGKEFDVCMADLADAYEEKKQHKKWCKGKTVYRLKGDKAGEWTMIKAPFTPHVAGLLREKYGKKMDEILNERFMVAS